MYKINIITLFFFLIIVDMLFIIFLDFLFWNLNCTIVNSVKWNRNIMDISIAWIQKEIKKIWKRYIKKREDLSKKLLIIGGTGFLGYHVAKKAIKKKWIVHSFSSKNPNKKRLCKKFKETSFTRCTKISQWSKSRFKYHRRIWKKWSNFKRRYNEFNGL